MVTENSAKSRYGPDARIGGLTDSRARDAIVTVLALTKVE